MSLSVAAQAELEYRRRQRAGEVKATKYADFQAKYYDDPAGFMRDCITWQHGQTPKKYQLEALSLLPEHRRVSVRAPHGVGKTCIQAIAILWFGLTRDGRDWKIPVTASVFRQLSTYLWPEVHKWARRLRWDVIGRRPFDDQELQTMGLKLETGQAFIMTSGVSGFVEGAHADHLLYDFDEAKLIPDEMWDSAEGAFSVGEVYCFACSTPGPPAGRFYQIQSHEAGYEDWKTMHITMDMALEADMMSRVWADARAKQWGVESGQYKNRVLGEFAADQTTGVIPLSWLETAIARWYDWKEQDFEGAMTSIGVDVGGGGKDADKSTLALIYDGLKVLSVQPATNITSRNATMQLVGNVSGIMDRELQSNPQSRLQAVVDAIGIGAGVLHRLLELGFRAIGFVASYRTDLRDVSGLYGFSDWRSAGWWSLREMLDPISGIQICIPDDVILIGDLTSPAYRIVSDGRIQVESKDTIRRRLGRSTDYADALIHGVVGPILENERQRLAGGDTRYEEVNDGYSRQSGTGAAGRGSKKITGADFGAK